MTRRYSRYMIVLLPLALLAAIGVYTLSRDFSARGRPSAIEAVIAGRLRHMSIPRGARDAKNPVSNSAEVLAESMEHFADHCAFCHANDGSGNTPIGKGLYPKPPDMRTGDTQRMSDGEIYYIIHNGVRFTGMPAFGPENGDAVDEDSWKLVHFIRHLPAITDQEVERMKGMNPKSPADLEEEDEIRRFLEGGDAPPSNDGHHH